MLYFCLLLLLPAKILTWKTVSEMNYDALSGKLDVPNLDLCFSFVSVCACMCLGPC